MRAISLVSRIPSRPVAPMSQSTRFVAEYAKSNRSSCKKCSKTINAKALRLGSITPHPRGFAMTKWHHLSCFALASDSLSSAQDIEGFDSLEGSDQEALKELVESLGTNKDEAEKRDDIEEQESGKRNMKEVKGSDQEASKKLVESLGTTKGKARKRDDSEEQESGNTNTMKAKLSISGESNLDIAFSVSDVKNKYKDATLPSKWKAFETTIFRERDDGLEDSSKIAAFDFDGCLANTSVKRVGPDAWSLLYPSIPDKLRSLYNDGYKLVIFTNEANIERWKKKRQVAVDSKIGRLDSFIKTANVPIQVFIACGIGSSDGKENPYRKPKPGMWHLMEKHFNSGIAIDMDQSFYVGDAAGRNNDHSDSDLKFAQTIGLKFHVPEDYFDK